MKLSMLLKAGLVIDPTNQLESTCDLRLVDGQITEIGPSLKPMANEDVFDASGLFVSTGFIDLHTHLRDFAQSDREDIESGTHAAACGGYTTVVAMANTDPPIDNVAMLSLLAHNIEEKACIEVLPVACVTRQMSGCDLTDMDSLAQLGAIAFSDDGMPISNLAVLRRALEYARLADRLIISHAEDKDLSGLGTMHEGLESTKLGLPAIPYAAETAAIAREIEVVRLTGCRLHIAHVSSADAVELIRTARLQGLPITADVTPHHLTLTAADIKDFDTAYKMNPPLRDATDQAALIAGLQDGTLDAIATDHAPHTNLDKSMPFDKAPFGVIGLETAFPLTFEKLVVTGHMTRLAYFALLTTNPAKVLGLPQPSIRVGDAANLAILHPEHRWLYNTNQGHSKSENSPFNGRMLTGKVLLTIYNGKAVYKDNELIEARLNTAFVNQ